jgi:hypothetical protein
VVIVHSLRVQSCHTPPMGRIAASCSVLGTTWPAVGSWWQVDKES